MNRGPCVLGAFPCFQLISSFVPGPGCPPIAVCERGWRGTEAWAANTLQQAYGRDHSRNAQGAHEVSVDTGRKGREQRQ